MRTTKIKQLTYIFSFFLCFLPFLVTKNVEHFLDNFIDVNLENNMVYNYKPDPPDTDPEDGNSVLPINRRHDNVDVNRNAPYQVPQVNRQENRNPPLHAPQVNRQHTNAVYLVDNVVSTIQSHASPENTISAPKYESSLMKAVKAEKANKEAMKNNNGTKLDEINKEEIEMEFETMPSEEEGYKPLLYNDEVWDHDKNLNNKDDNCDYVAEYSKLDDDKKRVRLETEIEVMKN